jgi:glycosyltransferase involved in cell wall biosynthesis
MKVCYILPQCHIDSAENFYHIINFLENLGKQVELFVIIEHGDSKLKIKNTQLTFILNEGINTKSHFSRALILIQIYFHLYKKGVKIFYSRASLTGVLPMIIANRILNFNRAKVIFWSCGIDVIKLSFFPNKKNIKRLLSKVIARFVFIGINYLATGPEKMAKYYHKNFNISKDKIITLYNDISLTRFFPLSSEERFILKNEVINLNKIILLFVHTFNRSRGADLLPLIALELKKNNINAIIIAIGRPGDYSSELEFEIKKSQLEDYLINLGQIPNRKIQKYYQISDLFLMPSKGEGFPRVMLEAMACGSAPLAYDVGGVSEIMTSYMHKELLIPLNEIEKFVTQSIKLTQNTELLNKLKNNSYEKVKNYSTENIVEMYVEALNKI